jgi:hypothetical protein
MSMTVLSSDSPIMLRKDTDNEENWSLESEAHMKHKHKWVRTCCCSFLVDEDPEFVEEQEEIGSICSTETMLNSSSHSQSVN